MLVAVWFESGIFIGPCVSIRVFRIFGYIGIDNLIALMVNNYYLAVIINAQIFNGLLDTLQINYPDQIPRYQIVIFTSCTVVTVTIIVSIVGYRVNRYRNCR